MLPEHNLPAKMKPLLRGHFHQGMFFIALGALVPLVLNCEAGPKLYSVIIYAVCALSMLGISTLYHRVTWSPPQRLFWKKLDHCGIYLMIAGTFTPIAVMGLSESSAMKLLITIWAVALGGIVQSFFFVHVPKYISSILYLFAGYLILPYFSELILGIGSTNSVLIIVGGIIYSLGALSYAIKKPAFRPVVFGYHEFFHILINIGAMVHFIVVHSLVKNS
jgi:hemolysin III